MKMESGADRPAWNSISVSMLSTDRTMSDALLKTTVTNLFVNYFVQSFFSAVKLVTALSSSFGTFE